MNGGGVYVRRVVCSVNVIDAVINLTFSIQLCYPPLLLQAVCIEVSKRWRRAPSWAADPPTARPTPSVSRWHEKGFKCTGVSWNLQVYCYLVLSCLVLCCLALHFLTPLYSTPVYCTVLLSNCRLSYIPNTLQPLLLLLVLLLLLYYYLMFRRNSVRHASS